MSKFLGLFSVILGLALALGVGVLHAQQPELVYIYDDLGRLAKVANVATGEVATYQYDAVGNILSVTRTTGGLPPPSITGVSPTSGDQGETVCPRVEGESLLGVSVSTDNPDLLISDVRTSETTLDLCLEITFLAAAGPALVTVSNPIGSTDFTFEVIAASPTIVSLDPTSGPPTRVVTISGAAFSPVPSENLVSFGGVAAPVFSSTVFTIKTTVPAGAPPGPVDVIVTVKGQQSNAVSFTVTTPAGPPPVANTITPNKGSLLGGGTVTITGTDFTANSRVLIGSAEAESFTLIDSTTIEAVVPPGPVGAADVIVRNGNGDGYLPGGFTYLDGPPLAVDAISPLPDSVDVPTNASVSAVFSAPVNQATIDTSTYSLAPCNTSNQVPGSFAFNGNDTGVVFTPSGNLVADTCFALSLTQDIESPQGVPLNAPVSVSFTTGEGVDTSSPAVEVFPADGEAHISDRANIDFTFSEPIDPVTVNTAALSVTNDGQPVTGTISLGPGNRGITFNPDGPFTLDSRVDVALSSSVTDMAGNPIIGSSGPGTDFQSHFFIKLPGEVVWVNPTGGSWDNPSNWDTGQLPGPDNDVAVSSNGDITVTHSRGTTSIRSLHSEDAIVVSGGSLTISGPSQINGEFTVSGGTLSMASESEVTSTLTITGGFLVSTGTVNVSGGTSFTGGEIRGTGRVNANGGLSISGGSLKRISGGTLNNTGAGTWTGTGNLDIRNNGSFLNSGDFDVQNDQTVTTIFGGGITNSGSFTKSGGTGVTQVNATFNNSGTVEVQSGTLGLGGGGTSSGTFAVPAPNVLNFNEGVHVLGASSEVTGDGTVRFSGSSTFRSVTIEGTYNVRGLTLVEGSEPIFNTTSPEASTATLTVNGGVLTSNGVMNVSGGTSFTGGEIRGTGRVNANGGLAISGGNLKGISGGTLNNTGAGTWTGTGNLDIRNNGSFLNSGDFDVQNDQTVTTIFGGGITNSGSFTKSGGTGVTQVNATFNNSGTVEVQSGTLRLNGGGTSSGTFIATSPGILNFTGASIFTTHTIQNGASFTGTGVTQVSGGIVSLGEADTDTFSATTFTIAGGDLVSTGTLNVDGLTSFTGGEIQGTGRVNANGGLAISGGNLKGISGGTLNNTGAGTWTGTGNLDIRNNGSFLNSGDFDVQNDQTVTTIFGGGITNSGSFTKSGGTGVTQVNATFNNSGTVEVQSGTLGLGGGGTSSGTFAVPAPNVLNFNEGVHVLGASSEVTGDGTVRFSGSSTFRSVTIEGTYNVRGLTLVEGSEPIFNTTSPEASTATLTVNGGVLTSNGVMNVSGGTSFTGGEIRGTGRVNANGGLAISGGNLKGISGGTLNNTGAGTWTGTGNLDIRNNGSFLNSGDFDVQNDQTVTTIFGGGITNSGSFTKSGGTGVTQVNATFNNSGTVEVQSGTLRLNGGGTSSGTFIATSPGILNFTGASIFTTHTIQNGASFTGTGVTQVSGGIVSLGEADTDTFSATTFTIAGGDLVSTGTLNVDGLTSFTGGEIQGTGRVNANGGLAISGGNLKGISGGTLNNTGAGTWTGTGNLDIRNNGNFLNSGDFDVQNDQTVTTIFGGGITNSGSFTKSGGTGVTQVNATFNNSGTVEVQSGTLRLNGGGTSSGTFTVSSPNTLDFNDGVHRLDASSQVNGDGTVRFSGSSTFRSVTIEGTYNVRGLTLVEGSEPIFNTTSPEASTSTLTVNGGNLVSNGVLNVSGATSFTGGEIRGTGVVNANGGLSISGGNLKRISGGTLNNTGAGTWTGTGNLDIRDNGNFINSGDFDVQNDQTVTTQFGGAINNQGTFTKSSGTGTTQVNAVFNNNGTVEVESGTLHFTRGYAQTAGTTILSGGGLSSTTTLDIQGGSLSGFGSVTGDVSNAGLVIPGLSPGNLKVMGAYNQSATGSLNIEIGGPTAGTDFDHLDISDLATLLGTLNITLISGFVPDVGDSFEIMTFGSRSGEFATVTGLDIGGGKFFQPIYTNSSLTLEVVSAP